MQAEGDLHRFWVQRSALTNPEGFLAPSTSIYRQKAATDLQKNPKKEIIFPNRDNRSNLTGAISGAGTT